MVLNCCVSGCNNEWTSNGNIKFHRPSANMVVCGDHFFPDIYSESHCKNDVLNNDTIPSNQKLQSLKVENTLVKSELCVDRMQRESPVEQENQLMKIKQEIVDIDVVEDQVEPLCVKVENDCGEIDDESEFVTLDATDCEEPTLLKQRNTDDLPVEKFEQVTVKEEVDFTSSYCEMCNIKFDQKDQFDKHCLLHTKNNTYFCFACLELYKTKESITEHLSKHRNIQTLCKCSLCNFTFGSKEDFDMHTKTFKHVKLFSCDECGKDFFLKRNMTVHRRLHTNPIFNCNICGRKFARRLYLQNHIKVHENKPKKPRTRKCLKCGFSTKNLTVFAEHKKIHNAAYIVGSANACTYVINFVRIN